MKIKGLEYLLIGAEDVAEAAATWREMLGLAASEPCPPGTECLALGNGVIRIVADTDHVGLLAIALEVEGLGELVTKLREEGIAVSDPETEEDAMAAEIEPASTYGVPIRLIEHVGKRR
ncbi:MAG: hypothetical protein QME71_01485 [Dehalococcoidia bacterium]|nr:hypothetical protein [Dehalococcoidia bacterium]